MNDKLKPIEKLLKEMSEKLDKLLVATIISNKSEKEQIEILKGFKERWSLRDIENWSGIDRHKFSKKTTKKKKLYK